jgi:eukaryotic-like serine/threonine-protein kinase
MTSRGRRDRVRDVEKRAMRASQLSTRGRSRDPTDRLDAAEGRPAHQESSAGPIVLDRYRLVRRLGAGAFGTVWHARDERLERDVAVKILPRERIIGGRFEREAKAAARLAHPGIVTLYEAAVDDDGAYLVSELVRGGTLAALLEAGRLSDRDIVAIGASLCEALDHAHSHGVVHRDVKPSNILVPGRAGNPPQSAKLTDFGVARVVGGDTLTRTGDVIGTMAYMAPEQAEGREAGAAADLYSLALVVYEALTGVNPVLTGTVALRARRLSAYLPPLRRQRRELPRELGYGIDLALRPRAGERGTVAELRRALSVSLELVDDEPGVVTAPWPTTARTQVAQVARDARRQSPPPRADATPARSILPGGTGRWPVRALGAGTAAGLAAWIAANPLSPSPLAPAAAALIAGLLVLALPRLGWLALVLGAGLIAVLDGLPGLALLLLLAGLLPLLLMPRRAAASLPAICPALGVVGLAGAWPALAGWAGSPWRRAALGATGWAWLLLAAPLTGQTLYVRVPERSPPASLWMSSLQLTAQHVLLPLLNLSLLAPAVVWGLGAMVMPLIRARRWGLPAALLGATVWAALVAIGTGVVLNAGPGAHGLILAGEGLLGGLAGAIVAAATSLVLGRRNRHDPADLDPELP